MIVPVGRKILVLPLNHVEQKLPSGLIMPASAMADLTEAKIVSVSKEIEHLYKIGDMVLLPSKKGIGQMVNGVLHLWIDTMPEKEEIWGIVQPEIQKEDKQDNL